MDVLCTDKTGTLTEDCAVVVSYVGCATDGQALTAQSFAVVPPPSAAALPLGSAASPAGVPETHFVRQPSLGPREHYTSEENLASRSMLNDPRVLELGYLTSASSSCDGTANSLDLAVLRCYERVNHRAHIQQELDRLETHSFH